MSLTPKLSIGLLSLPIAIGWCVSSPAICHPWLHGETSALSFWGYKRDPRPETVAPPFWSIILFLLSLRWYIYLFGIFFHIWRNFNDGVAKQLWLIVWLFYSFHILRCLGSSEILRSNFDCAMNEERRIHTAIIFRAVNDQINDITLRVKNLYSIQCNLCVGWVCKIWFLINLILSKIKLS